MVQSQKNSIETEDTGLEPSELVMRHWRHVESLVAHNAMRVIKAFANGGLSAPDLAGSAGYGYDDRGRERLDGIVAEIFGAETALVRMQWSSGTHTIITALRGMLSAGDVLWIAGAPVYDTLSPFLFGDHPSGLKALGITVVSLGLTPDGRVDWPDTLAPRPQVVYAQRSRGYQDRPSWGQGQFEDIADHAHALGAAVLVDNCYGEFTKPEEPTAWGIDVVAGSLLKNPGGGIAPTGGYVAGRKVWVDRIAEALFGPAIGREIGPTGDVFRSIAQGWFIAPTMVGEALMGGIYAQWLFDKAGYSVSPRFGDAPYDIVTAIDLRSAGQVVAFCQAVQSMSPVDATAHPEPWDMPGYSHEVIMAAGGFVPGGSLELSADGPMRAPYRVYLQGGLSRWHTKLAADAALEAIQ